MPKWKLASHPEEYFHSSACFYILNNYHQFIRVTHWKDVGEHITHRLRLRTEDDAGLKIASIIFAPLNFLLSMRLKLILSVVFACATISLFAQSNYKQSIGLRLGSGYYDVIAAAYKTFITKPGALEFDLGIRPYNVHDDWVNVSFSGTYQHHFDIKPVKGLKWFIGGGIVTSNSFSSNKDYRGFNLGIFPTGGADYKFSKIPLSVSADIRSTIHIAEAYDYYDTFYQNVGVSARYTF